MRASYQPVPIVYLGNQPYHSAIACTHTKNDTQALSVLLFKNFGLFFEYVTAKENFSLKPWSVTKLTLDTEYINYPTFMS